MDTGMSFGRRVIYPHLAELNNIAAAKRRLPPPITRSSLSAATQSNDGFNNHDNADINECDDIGIISIESDGANEWYGYRWQ